MIVSKSAPSTSRICCMSFKVDLIMSFVSLRCPPFTFVMRRSSFSCLPWSVEFLWSFRLPPFFSSTSMAPTSSCLLASSAGMTSDVEIVWDRRRRRQVSERVLVVSLSPRGYMITQFAIPLRQGNQRPTEVCFTKSAIASCPCESDMLTSRCWGSEGGPAGWTLVYTDCCMQGLAEEVV